MRTAGGRVLVPPFEYDPETGEAASEMVDVASEGVIERAAWVPEPLRTHPLDRPFAWALVKLDGADTPCCTRSTADRPIARTPGARVRIRWSAETTGHLSDIECFELEAFVMTDPVQFMSHHTAVEYKIPEPSSAQRSLR